MCVTYVLCLCVVSGDVSENSLPFSSCVAGPGAFPRAR